MGSKTRRLRLKARPVIFTPESIEVAFPGSTVVEVPPRFAAMSSPGIVRALLVAGLLLRFSELDRAVRTWPRCADGTRVHDMKGQPRCPACGFEPPLLSPSNGANSLPGHARARGGERQLG